MADVDRSIPFIETHHHLWERERFHYDWLTDPGWPGHNALLGDYRMIRSTIGEPWRFFKEFYAANVIKSVHVEAAYAGPDPVEETAWLDGVAKEHGFPHALVVFCDIEQDDGEAQLARHLEASSLTRGVRIRAHPDDADSPAFRRGYAALGRHGLSYELNASPGKLLSGRDVALAVGVAEAERFLDQVDDLTRELPRPAALVLFQFMGAPQRMGAEGEQGQGGGRAGGSDARQPRGGGE